MPEDKPTYEALTQENADLKLELTEVKAQLAELRRLMYGVSTSESRSGGSNYTPAKKKRKKK